MEMLLVPVLMGLIAAVTIPQIMKLMGGAKHKAAKTQLETLGQSLTNYERVRPCHSRTVLDIK